MSQNGKGSAQRRQTKEERKQFESNWDRIFKRRKKKK